MNIDILIPVAKKGEVEWVLPGIEFHPLIYGKDGHDLNEFAIVYYIRAFVSMLPEATIESVFHERKEYLKEIKDFNYIFPPGVYYLSSAFVVKLSHKITAVVLMNVTVKVISRLIFINKIVKNLESAMGSI